MIGEKNDQKPSGNFSVIAFRRVHKSVLNVTYFTWLHNCEKDSQNKLETAEARIKIWKILLILISTCLFSR